MEDKKLKVKCVNAHDRCAGSAPCPYCEPVTPLRYEDGTFAPQGTSKIVRCLARIPYLSRP
jgi:hypothetical protein